MNRLNDEVKAYRRRIRRRYLASALVTFTIGALIGHLTSKENHAKAYVPVSSLSAADELRLTPYRHLATRQRADRSRQPTPAHTERAVQPVGSPFDAWRSSAAALAVVRCESGRDGSWAWHYGKYRGYWQIGPNEWRDWGGLKYAPSPELATRYEQDLVAYTGWLGRGWGPWTCARIVGLI